MAEVLKTAFLAFFREGEGLTPVLQAHIQICMADPRITELKVKRALGFLNSNKVLKTLSSNIAPALRRPRLFASP